MSYDFRLKLPRTRAGRSGAAAVPDRVAAAADVLRRHEPEVVIDGDEDGFVARSAELGEVHVDARTIRLGLSMGSEPRAVYAAIHGLLRRFDGAGYEAEDPQLMRGRVDYDPDFATFMAQYREHFDCSEAEFRQWCRGETPPEWAARDARRADGEQRAARLPNDGRIPHAEQRAMDNDALWAHLLDVVARNDGAIAALGIGPYLDDLATAQAARFEGYQRPPGRWFESLMNAPWYQGSSLHYEALVLNLLWQRNHPPAMAGCPQRYTLSTPAAPSGTSSDWQALINSITPLLRDQGLIHRPPMASRIGDEVCVMFDGIDAAAIHRVAWPLAVAFPRRILARLRFGIDGATEDLVEHPGVG